MPFCTLKPFSRTYISEVYCTVHRNNYKTLPQGINVRLNIKVFTCYFTFKALFSLPQRASSRWILLALTAKKGRPGQRDNANVYRCMGCRVIVTVMSEQVSYRHWGVTEKRTGPHTGSAGIVNATYGCNNKINTVLNINLQFRHLAPNPEWFTRYNRHQCININILDQAPIQ